MELAVHRALTKQQYLVFFGVFAIESTRFRQGSIRFQRLTSLAAYLLFNQIDITKSFIRMRYCFESPSTVESTLAAHFPILFNIAKRSDLRTGSDHLATPAFHS